MIVSDPYVVADKNGQVLFWSITLERATDDVWSIQNEWADQYRDHRPVRIAKLSELSSDQQLNWTEFK